VAKEKKIARYKAGLWLTKDNKLIRMHGNMTESYVPQAHGFNRG